MSDPAALRLELTRKARGVGLRDAAALETLGETEAARAALAALTRGELLAWTVPERDGGAATGGACAAQTVSVRALCAVREELAWHSGMLDVMFVMQGLGSHPVVLGGEAELRRHVLTDVVAGKFIAAFALTEAGAGSSLGEVATRAERSRGGWLLRGTKTFISNAGIADFYTVLARTSGEPGDGGKGSLTMFYVPATSQGLDVRPFEVMAPHPIGEVRFQDVHVPAEHVLGSVGDGMRIALATLERFRTSVAAAACGFARRALDESCAHLSSREQFGKPLAGNQGLRFDLAEMDVRLEASRLLVAEAARLLDEGAEVTAAVARAKLFATETASWVCDRAVQHFGGLGVKRGVPVERLFREVRALRIYEGTSEIQKLILAKAVLERGPLSR